VENNTVNGKPLVYLEDVTNCSVGDAGQVVLVGCDGIRVENLNLSRATVGVELRGTNNSVISCNNITANFPFGILIGSSSNNNSISGNNIADNDCGILLYLSSSNNNISGNDVANNWEGIWLNCSFGNSINGNNVTSNNFYGIELDNSLGNSISGNNIVSNSDGINLYSSSNNRIYHNNFINNPRQVDTDSANAWDNGYPSGGNYWSDYAGEDLHSGPYQNETGSDGIGDTPYVIDAQNLDNYPLMGPWGPATPTGENVTVNPGEGGRLIFENVTSPGMTTIDTTYAGPEPPSGLCFTTRPPIYYLINTSASYSGKIRIIIQYNDSGMTQNDEANLKLLQWDPPTQQWLDITTYRDVENNVIYGEASHLSIFAMAVPLPQSAAGGGSRKYVC